jgi:hypothetical protein
VVQRKKTSITIKITYLFPEFKTKTICILAANGISQISMNNPEKIPYAKKSWIDHKYAALRLNFCFL